MLPQELAPTSSPVILEDVLTLYSGNNKEQVRIALQDGNTKRLEKLLLVDPLKNMCRIFSWIYALDLPKTMLKQQAAELLATNWRRCTSSASKWSVPVSNDASLVNAYLELARKYGISWLNYVVDKAKTNFIPYREMAFHSTLATNFSPYYKVIANIAIFSLLGKPDTDKTIVLEIPKEVCSCITNDSTARIVMYTFYEVLRDSKFPALQIMRWEDVKAPTADLSIHVNGQKVLLTSFKAKNQIAMLKAKDPQIVPNSTDLTVPIKYVLEQSSCGYAYIDFSTATFPAHPDAGSEVYKYQVPYVALYLAKALSTTEICHVLIGRPMLTTTKLKQLIQEKESLYAREISKLASACTTACTDDAVNTTKPPAAPLFHNYASFIDQIRTVSNNVAQTDEYESDIEIADELIYLESHLTRKRIKIPVRSSNCRHFNRSMDLDEYIEGCKETNLWNCTVCGEPATFAQLHIDAFYWFLINIVRVTQDVVHLDLNTGEIQLGDEDDNEAVSSPSGWSFGGD